jgi:Insect cuticle protein
VKVKYTAGVEGFVPETSGATAQAQTRVQASSWQSQHAQNVKLAQQQHQTQQTKTAFQAPRVQAASRISHDDSNVNADASYQISYNTGEHAREEKSDASGNVQGRYSYVDELGTHDLSYIAGPTTGS